MEECSLTEEEKGQAYLEFKKVFPDREPEEGEMVSWYKEQLDNKAYAEYFESLTPLEKACNSVVSYRRRLARLTELNAPEIVVAGQKESLDRALDRLAQTFDRVVYDRKAKLRKILEREAGETG